MLKPSLPIDEVLPELMAALRTNTGAVLTAEPGAGKTTRVPLALLDEPWLQGRKIIMLEPRRLAARSAAKYMADMLGEPVGATVGYRVRLDTKVSRSTRIEVVTEGILTRMLQEDQALEQVGAVLFDEFHERHLHGDLGLALCLQTQALLRDDLRLLIMSATLDTAAVAALLGEAPVIASKGRAYPVQTVYLSSRPEGKGKLETNMASLIQQALRESDGDVLAFLPGIGEIRRTASVLAQAGIGTVGAIRVTELHGSLPLEKQDEAIAPCRLGERKVVLATSIAESSLTVEGVRIVVDSGLMRVPRFSPRTGMSRLETVQVSQASADQRKGRAGRLASGVCYRLWTEQEQRYLPEQSAPELAEADLTQLALELAVWGIQQPSELRWLDEPPQAAFEHATELLKLLRAIDASGKPTGWGRRMARLGLHPRLGYMLLQAKRLGLAETASELAALLSERDLLPQERNVDLLLRVDALKGRGAGGADRGAVQRMKAQAAQWLRMLDAAEGEDTGGGSEAEQREQPPEGEPFGLLLAFAFPDRIAQRRNDGRYLLANGRGAALPELQPLSRAAYLVAAELDDSGTESRIRLAAMLQAEQLQLAAGEQIEVQDSVEWDASAGAVRARRRQRLGALVLKEGPLPQPHPEQVAMALLEGIRQSGLGLLQMSKQSSQLLARMRLMSGRNKDWPDISEETLLATLDDWLLPHLIGMRNRNDLQRLNMIQVLESLYSWQQRQQLDEMVPTHITVPSGSRIPVDYSDPEAPFIAVRLQELFGLRETPLLAGGKLPLTIHLLSPSQRPVQVTRDLSSFWSGAYFEVKKDLKGRYPKHYWPDDPYAAQPTNRAKPRGQ
ncbi:ATP-dependent helicase HrpB [Paenibacillus sp. NPDC058174]|uniref:ATP-dependent helicase HrpB n=1 Tax=Paenibacillus sp. NPDC058174 TaxID=3346366 RepID=UPI0036DEE7C3